MFSRFSIKVFTAAVTRDGTWQIFRQVFEAYDELDKI